MKKFIITEEQFNTMIEDEKYSTPDTIFNKNYLSWRDKDAYPFFVLQNGEVVVCDSQTTHNNYLKINFANNANLKRKFINNIIVQGRYWKDSYIFSVWVWNDDNVNYIKAAIWKLANKKKPCTLFYKDKKYKIRFNNDEYYKSNSFYDVQFEKTSDSWLNYFNKGKKLSDEKFKLIEHWFESDMNYISNTYCMLDYINGKNEFRDLNDYELLAATCYQVWGDFLKTEETFDTEDFKLYINLKYNTSFDSLWDYFHKRMRKTMYCKSKNMDDLLLGDETSDSEMETVLNNLGFNSSEIEVINYSNSNDIYACKVRTLNKELVIDAVQQLRASDKYVVDHVFGQKIKDGMEIYGFRLREKAY